MTRRILRRPEVEKMTGLARSTIYNRIDQGTFPKPIPLGGRLVGWLENDIKSWIDARVSAATGNLKETSHD